MSVPDNERQLLLALLAFQNNFIDRAALLAGFDAWTQDKATPLAAVLVAQKAIGDEERKLLEAFVDRHLARHGNDVQRSLANISNIHSSLREKLGQAAGPELNASLVNVGRDADPWATIAHTVGASSAEGTRFRILRPHARGGLGEVFVAEDGELRREVALKQIQPQHADHPDSRARFLQEAEITGGLEHPSIVPVYGLGTYADGRPFYAMRFIRGDSLQEATNRFYDPNQKLDEATRSVEFRKLLQRMIDVCNAIDYAHSRGVLHRDLKPGNIMLGKYGETLVVDWGLAKAVKAVAGAATVVNAERTLCPSLSGNTAETQYGSAIGTPAYMSPEQATGRLDELGPATDVYGLGATLYHLLTGKPPVEARDVGEALRRVSQGDIPSPESVGPTLPKPLAAICRKAMATRASDRYKSAAALADDLERWLADEQVSARRDSLTEKAGRWVRRHRTRFAFAAAATAATIVALVVGIVVVRREQGRTEEQRRLAETRKDEAERQRTVAEQERDKADNLASTNVRLAAAERDQRRKFQRQFVSMLFDQALKECQRDPAVGATRLAKCLVQAAEAQEAELEAAVRLHLAAWLMDIHELQMIFEKPRPGEFGRLISAPAACRALAMATPPGTACWDWSDGPAKLGKIQLRGALPIPLAISPDGTWAVSMDATRVVCNDVDHPEVEAFDLPFSPPVVGMRFGNSGRDLVVAQVAGERCEGRLFKLKTVRKQSGARVLDCTPVFKDAVILTPGWNGPPNGPFSLRDPRITWLNQWLKFSDDDSKVFFRNDTGAIEGRATSDGSLVGPPIPQDQAPIFFRPVGDGSELVSADTWRAGRIHHWKTSTGEETRASIPTPGDIVNLIPVGHDIVVVAPFHVAYWNSFRGPFSGNGRSQIANACVNAKGDLLAISNSIDIQLYKLPTFARLGGNIDSAKCDELAFDRDGRLFSRNLEGSFLRKPAIGRHLKSLKFESQIYHLSFDPKNDDVLFVGGPGLRTIDWRSGENRTGFFDPSQRLVSAFISPSDATAVIRRDAANAEIWDLAEHRKILESVSCDIGIAAGNVRSTCDWWIAPSREQGRLSFYDKHDGRLLGTLPSPGGASHVEISPNGKSAVSVAAGAVSFVGLDPGGRPAVLHRLPSRYEVSAQPCFSFDGRYSALGLQDGRIILLNVETGEQLKFDARHLTPVTALRFLRDGNTLVSGSSDGQVCRWSIPGGKSLGSPIEFGATIFKIECAPDDSIVAVSSLGGVVELRETITWRALGKPLYNRKNGGSNLLFADRAPVLITSTGTVLETWRLPNPVSGTPSEVVSMVERHTGLRFSADEVITSMTPDQWQQIPKTD